MLHKFAEIISANNKLPQFCYKVHEFWKCYSERLTFIIRNYYLRFFSKIQRGRFRGLNMSLCSSSKKALLFENLRIVVVLNHFLHRFNFFQRIMNLFFLLQRNKLNEITKAPKCGIFCDDMVYIFCLIRASFDALLFSG